MAFTPMGKYKSNTTHTHTHRVRGTGRGRETQRETERASDSTQEFQRRHRIEEKRESDWWVGNKGRIIGKCSSL